MDWGWGGGKSETHTQKEGGGDYNSAATLAIITSTEHFPIRNSGFKNAGWRELLGQCCWEFGGFLGMLIILSSGHLRT